VPFYGTIEVEARFLANHQRPEGRDSFSRC
jgi:hypothetical protein